ncbi:hypothetical protein CSUI_011100 [Cystoisospora suis]|uniref:Uncharacterized protein n=1 Tax=Cystoisospora suis TaxID=483139 RepID=A0A2C6KCR2_9APIC|nr:hypothetical protein CSUI_011100 [Cystoisospora suis]
MSSGSGDVKVHTEKEISPFLRSCIGEPKKHRYKLPHILFPYHSPYRSPHRQRWWPGSLPRFPYHSHPKRWAPSCRSLSISFFAYHGLRDFSKKNFYELIHSLPLRGGTSHFWREAESADPYKYEGRKAGKLKSRGRLIEDFNTKVKIRFTGQSPSHTSRSRRNNQEESLCLVERHESEKREERKDHVADTKREEEIKTQGDDQQKKRLVEEENEKKKREWQIIQENKPRAGRKQLIFTPKEIYFKVR